ncbi:phage tail tube protein [uncultured Vibrio sp.]|uniref:phage tail tube protein n=1 Tax=uncultured Vibrio sp. TaxID=114054 RepID=UPI00260C90AB|nr:phage tail tube protein [uncultured Vibrio sp.]
MATKITSRGVLSAGSLGRLPIKEGTEVGFGNLKREPVMGDEGVLGYTEMYSDAPSIKVTIVHAKDTDEDALKNFIDEDVIFETNTGKTYTLRDAWVVDPLSLNVKDGQLEILFNGLELIPQ